MSIQLSKNSSPPGIHAKHFGDVVRVGSYTLTLEDLFQLAFYGLTGSPLTGEDDIRLQFLESVKSIEVQELQGGKALVGTIPLPIKEG